MSNSLTFLKKNKLAVMLLAFLSLFAISAMASGTGDSLGLASSWTKIKTWFDDPAVTSVIGILLLVAAVLTFLRQMYVLGIVFLIFIVFITNLTTIAESFSGAGLI